MKETLESVVAIVAVVVVCEVINEVLEPVLGYRLIDVKVDKKTIKRSK